MKGRVLVGLMVTVLSSASGAQSSAPITQCGGASSLVFSDTVAFFLDAPTGWTIDCTSGKRDGVLTAVYRIGETWRTGHAVMYANVLTPKGATVLSFAMRVRGEVKDWTAGVPDAKVTVRRSLATRGGPPAVIRQFTSAGKSLFEIVAYVPRGRVIPVLAMTARSDTAFNNALPAFQRFVHSYAPGPNVQVRSP